MNTSAATAAATAATTDTLGFQGLDRLTASAQADPRDPRTIKAVAQQFEALLLQRMLTTMEQTKLGPDMLGDNAGPMFTSLLNQQLAQTISQAQGIGLAQFVARELAQRYGAHAGQGAPPTGRDISAYRAAAGATPVPAPVAATATAPAASTASGVANAAGAQAAPSAPDAPAPDSALARRARAFVTSILPSVREAAAQLQVSPVALLAQAALETGWGSHAPGNALFGIKAGPGWSGASFDALTHEVRDGVTRLGDAAFRAYRSAGDSVRNYAQMLLESPRYPDALGRGSDIAGFAAALQRGGYATDPDYAAKLLAVAQSGTMRNVLQAVGLASSSAQP